MRSPLRTWTVLTWLLVTIAAGCADKAELTKTQITLRVSPAGEDLVARLTRLKMRVYHASSRGWLLSSQVSVDTARVRWPLDVPILPGPVDPSVQRIEVIVDGYADEELLAQARVLSGFDTGALRVLPLGLYPCASGVCANESCHGPACLSCSASGSCEVVTTVDARALPVYEPTQAPHDEEVSGPGAESGTDAATMANDAAQPFDAAGASPPCSAGCDAGQVAPADTGADAMGLSCAGGCAAPRPICETQTQSCVECTSDGQCPSERRHCDQFACVACAADAHCATPTPYCVQHQCVACRSPADCRAPQDKCVAGTCTMACTSSTDCTTAGTSCDTTTSTCSCMKLGLACEGGSLLDRDSCGHNIVKSGCCGRGCTGTACNPPDPRASRGCYGGDLYYLDSCGLPGELIEDCCEQGCVSGACRPQVTQYKLVCSGGDSYWQDSCGKRGGLAQNCCGQGYMADGSCAPVNMQARRSCVQGNAYWLDSCGMQTTLLQNCEGRGCVGGSCNP